MPFHNYSSVSVRVKAKEQAFRHSSPPVCDATKDLKLKESNNNDESTVKTSLLLHEDIKGSNATPGIKLRRDKGQKIPIRSNSNPAYFGDYYNGKNVSSDGDLMLGGKEDSGVINPNFVESSDQDIRKKSLVQSQQYRGVVSNGSLSLDRGTSTTSCHLNNTLESTTITKPSVVVTKPPVPSSAGNGSPISSVKLRSKATNSPKGSRRRQGFVLDPQVSISSPVLISHVSSSDTGIKLRGIEEQEQLLSKLSVKSSEKTRKAEKSSSQTNESNSPGTRMAERIQRTIKALYTSNSSTKKGYTIQGQLLAQDEFEYSDGSASPEVKGRPPMHNQYSQLETSSPKNDKRSTRKRSPKPSHKNNLQVKDGDGSRRFKWRGSVNKIVKKFGTGQPFVMNGTFEVHLEDCPPSPSNEFVPFIVELCCRIVEERGLHFTGIYRVPGNNAALSALQEDLNTRGAESIQADDERLRELNVVSSLLKSFFRKLPEPLFTNELYHDFIHANRQSTPESRLNNLRKLVHMLPGPHYETLKFLISHLRLVADNCESNKMEVRNLAIVFGPTLVRNTAADNTATMVTDMSDQCRIIESIIDHAEWFFSDNSDPAPVPSLISKETEKEHEAVPSIEFLLGNVGRKPGDTGTTESGKSKGSDDSENSFSRDLMDLIFGKKWKSTNANNQAVADEDDGGFEEYRTKKLDEVIQKKEETVPDAPVVETQKIPATTQQTSIPNVSERLRDFYQEYLERLSQTTVGQTLPTFSSADSSPRTTPRHSTVFNAPIVFPMQDTQARVGSRNRVGSDSQDPRYVASSYEMNPKMSPNEVVNRCLNAPQYKHPPNPYQPGIGSFQYSPPVSVEPAVSSPAATPIKPASVPVMRRSIPKPSPMHDVQSSNVEKRSSSSKTSSRKSSRSDGTPYADEHRLHEYPQIEPIVPTKIQPIIAPIDENRPPPGINERLVDELPKPIYATSPNSTRSRKSSSTSPEPSASKPKPVARGHSKKSSTGSVTLPSERPTQKRRKSPLKENFSVPLVASASSSDKLFSRYDPKRRGIRFVGAENDQTGLLQNTISPKKQQLTATERLFNGQPLRRKPSSRESRRNKVIRRHTLSGIQDLEAHSPSLRFKSNLNKASKGQNLSMYDLASANGTRSAMERLNPKGASTGMTLNNWFVQERLRNKTVQSSGSPSSSVRRGRDNKGQFHSYV